jgi:hypothetical protein
MYGGMMAGAVANPGVQKIGLGLILGVWVSSSAFAVIQGATMLPYVGETLASIVALCSVGVAGSYYSQTRIQQTAISSGQLPP